MRLWPVPLVLLLAGCPGKPPIKPPEPPAECPAVCPTGTACTDPLKGCEPLPPSDGVPAKGTPVLPELLLRPAPGARVTLRDGTPHEVFSCIACCMTPPAEVGNARWPLASASWQDFCAGYEANMFHARPGPFYGGTSLEESDWADIGGAYLGDPATTEWNPAFWSEFRSQVWHAAKAKKHVEVVAIDTWYCKHAASSWGDERMPWPQEDIDACGVRMTPVQERWVRKLVEEVGCFGNVVWITDNEGDQIRGTKREWYEQVHSIIRDEEQKSGCGFVHMVGTNNRNFADGPFDYVATHQRSALTEPIAGKWTINNERNPHFLPEQEGSYFAQAREKGLAWAFWRASMPEAAMRRTLDIMRDIVKGSQEPTGCFPPPEDDEAWRPGPVKTCSMREALEDAKLKVGDRRHLFPVDGTPEQKFEAMFETLELLAAEMRQAGHCAGRSRDSVFIRAQGGLWEEMHAVAATDGGYTGQPCKGATWIYGASTSLCDGPADLDRLDCKDYTAWLDGRRWDCTPKLGSRPVRPEGDPQRIACEQQAMGGVPAYRLDVSSGSLTLQTHSNPMQFIVLGSGLATLRCSVPSKPGMDLCGQQVGL